MIPKAHLREAAAMLKGPLKEPSSTERPLLGKRVLLVEDQSLIAIDTEELLLELGAEVVDIAASVDDALKAIERRPPERAVLDLNLGDLTSAAVAAELRRLDIPFVFATGYRDGVHIPEEYVDVPVVRKPISERALSAALGALV